MKPLIRSQGDASQQGPLVCFCKQPSCNIWAVAHPCYPWIWAALGCFALGPHEPLNLRSVSFSFLTRDSRFIGMTAIKKIRKGLGVSLSFHFSFLVVYNETQCPNMFIDSGLGFFDEERRFIRVKWAFSTLSCETEDHMGRS